MFTTRQLRILRETRIEVPNLFLCRVMTFQRTFSSPLHNMVDSCKLLPVAPHSGKVKYEKQKTRVARNGCCLQILQTATEISTNLEARHTHQQGTDLYRFSGILTL